MLTNALHRPTGHNLVVIWIALILASLTFLLGFDPILQRMAGTALPESHFRGYQVDWLYSFLAALGPVGRRWYVVFQAFDFLYIVIYGAAFVMTLSWAVNRLGVIGTGSRLTFALPIAAAAADVAEDLCLLALTFAFPERLAPLAVLASGLTIVKWILAGASLVLTVVVGSVAWIRKH